MNLKNKNIGHFKQLVEEGSLLETAAAKKMNTANDVVANIG